MIRSLNKAAATVAFGLLLLLPLVGCSGRPAPRPEAAPTHAAVADVASKVGGAGRTAAVVLGDVALIALQLDQPQPGGTSGAEITGDVKDAGDGTVSQGPAYSHGPGGSTGASPAMPGGAINPGGSTPGGSPNYTQAAPDGRGGLASQSGGSSTAPSTYGSTPLDVMNRIADRVKAEFPSLREVRLVYRPDDARKLNTIASDLAGGGNRIDAHRSELNAISARAVAAGTTTFSPQHPAQGTDTGRP